MLVEPFLEVGLGPGLVQPVSGVRSCFTDLLGNTFIIGSDLLEKGVASSWLGN